MHYLFSDFRRSLIVWWFCACASRLERHRLERLISFGDRLNLNVVRDLCVYTLFHMPGLIKEFCCLYTAREVCRSCRSDEQCAVVRESEWLKRVQVIACAYNFHH